MVKHIQSIKEFEEEVKKGAKVVDFFATWCAPCRNLGPLLDQFAEEHVKVDVLKVDVDELPELASRFFVTSIPFIVTFIDGTKTGENVGFLPKPSLDRFLKSALKI